VRLFQYFICLALCRLVKIFNTHMASHPKRRIVRVGVIYEQNDKLNIWA